LEKITLIEKYLDNPKKSIPKFHHQKTFKKKNDHQKRRLKFYSTKKKTKVNRKSSNRSTY
jgi:hypothetical protein